MPGPGMDMPGPGMDIPRLHKMLVHLCLQAEPRRLPLGAPPKAGMPGRPSDTAANPFAQSPEKNIKYYYNYYYDAIITIASIYPKFLRKPKNSEGPAGLGPGRVHSCSWAPPA